jgi:hypothetical protein
MSTPMEAIRMKCRWCCLDQPQEIRLCRSERSCPVWPLRFGKGMRGISPLKQIRLKCLDCTGGSPKDVKACDPTFDHCTLWPFRFGTNPHYSEEAREQRRAGFHYIGSVDSSGIQSQ